jgi:type IV secretory pathway VirD2 relaxase
MTEIVVKKNIKRKKSKRDKLKKWSVVFVEDSDDERDYKNREVEKITHIKTGLSQQILKLA